MNSSEMPVPIDGGVVQGMTPSEVHGGRYDSGTPVNGWAHRAVAVEMLDGLHMMLRVELMPSIAADFDAGRLAFGSVEVAAKSVADDGALRGAELSGHALTNRPANRSLLPSTAIRSGTAATTIALRGKASRNMPKRTMSDQIKTELEESKKEIVKDARAEEPPKEEPEMEKAAAEEPAAESIEALKARIEELEAQVAALLADAEARAEMAPSEEELEAKLEIERANLVDSMVRSGHILRKTRDLWLDVARKSGIDSARTMMESLRSVPKRQTGGGEAVTSATTKVTVLDSRDPYVIGMRAAGVSDEKIKTRLAARNKEV